VPMLLRLWQFLTVAHQGGLRQRWKTLRWYSRGLLLLAVVYAMTPVAWMDNWLPILGQLDELAVYSILLTLALKLSPLPEEERARLEAKKKLESAGPIEPGKMGHPEG